MRLIGPTRYYQEYFLRENVQELTGYAEIFRNQIEPSFGDLNDRANEIRDKKYEELIANTPDIDESGDNSMLCDMAEEVGIDFYLGASAGRAGVRNWMVAGIFHMFEQQAATFSSPNVLPQPPKAVNRRFPRIALKDVLLHSGINVDAIPAWSILEELNWAANVVKHGDGDSADKLEKLRPDLFMVTGLPLPIARSSIKPLAGQGIKLSEDDFERYLKAATEFWYALDEPLFKALGGN